MKLDALEPALERRAHRRTDERSSEAGAAVCGIDSEAGDLERTIAGTRRDEPDHGSTLRCARDPHRRGRVATEDRWQTGMRKDRHVERVSLCESDEVGSHRLDHRG